MSDENKPQIDPARQQELEILRQINRNTINAFRPLWERNAKLNYYEYGKRKKINNIKNYMPDMNKTPILVCGGGPSLGDHFDFIKEYRKKMVVFAVDMAMHSLVKHDIYPDFLVNVDPQGSILCECIKDLNLGKRKIPTIMLMSVFTSPEILHYWTGYVMYYRLFDPDNPVYTEQGEKYFSNLYGIPSKLNVGEFTVSMATFFSKYVAYTGIDFAFYGGKYRSDGSYKIEATEKESGDPTVDDSSMLLQDYKGDDIYTTDLMLDYCKQFETNLPHYEKQAKLFSLSKGIIQRPYALEEFKDYINNVLNT